PRTTDPGPTGFPSAAKACLAASAPACSFPNRSGPAPPSARRAACSMRGPGARSRNRGSGRRHGPGGGFRGRRAFLQVSFGAETRWKRPGSGLASAAAVPFGRRKSGKNGERLDGISVLVTEDDGDILELVAYTL